VITPAQAAPFQGTPNMPASEACPDRAGGSTPTSICAFADFLAAVPVDAPDTSTPMPARVAGRSQAERRNTQNDDEFGSTAAPGFVQAVAAQPVQSVVPFQFSFVSIRNMAADSDLSGSPEDLTCDVSGSTVDDSSNAGGTIASPGGGTASASGDRCTLPGGITRYLDLRGDADNGRSSVEQSALYSRQVGVHTKGEHATNATLEEPAAVARDITSLPEIGAVDVQCNMSENIAPIASNTVAPQVPAETQAVGAEQVHRSPAPMGTDEAGSPRGQFTSADLSIPAHPASNLPPSSPSGSRLHNPPTPSSTHQQTAQISDAVTAFALRVRVRETSKSESGSRIGEHAAIESRTDDLKARAERPASALIELASAQELRPGSQRDTLQGRPAAEWKREIREISDSTVDTRSGSAEKNTGQEEADLAASAVHMNSRAGSPLSTGTSSIGHASPGPSNLFTPEPKWRPRGTDPGSPADKIFGSEALDTEQPVQSGPLRNVRVQVGNDQTGRVDVHLAESRGELRVAVKTVSSDLGMILRKDLPGLVDRLEHTGFDATPSIPEQRASETVRQHAATADSANNSEDATPGGRDGREQQNPGDRRKYYDPFDEPDVPPMRHKEEQNAWSAWMQ
jgi:hypothetical protein